MTRHSCVSSVSETGGTGATSATGSLATLAFRASHALLALALLTGCDDTPRPELSPDADVEAVIGAQSGQTQAPPMKRGVVKVGDPAPNFQLYDINGDPVTLSEYRGSIVFINFWATWCGPCLAEMPTMEALYKAFERKDFEILAISTDAQGVAVTRPFRNEMKLTFPILHDSDYRVGLAYGARTLPMSFLVDRKGVIIHRIFGARDWESPEAKEIIRAALKAR